MKGEGEEALECSLCLCVFACLSVSVFVSVCFNKDWVH